MFIAFIISGPECSMNEGRASNDVDDLLVYLRPCSQWQVFFDIIFHLQSEAMIFEFKSFVIIRMFHFCTSKFTDALCTLMDFAHENDTLLNKIVGFEFRQAKARLLIG